MSQGWARLSTVEDQAPEDHEALPDEQSQDHTAGDRQHQASEVGVSSEATTNPTGELGSRNVRLPAGTVPNVAAHRASSSASETAGGRRPLPLPMDIDSCKCSL